MKGKIIKVRQGDNILYLHEDEYMELLGTYKQLETRLDAVCMGDCEHCWFGEVSMFGDARGTCYCKVKQYFDPRKNLVNN